MKQLILFLLATLFSFQLLQAQCMDDCVWPGDMNANGIANNLDFLSLGFSYQSTGPARVNQSTIWEALEADNWVGTLPILGANYKHSDADGNGVVDEMDRFPISINYNQTNNNFTDLLGNNLVGDDLFAVLVDSITSPGGSLFFDVHLGDVDNPINDMYGIGFQIKMDTQYVENVLVDYTDSWLGLPDDILAYDKFSDEIDHEAIAITRFDGNSVSGFGKIARVEIVITDVILGLQTDTTACLPFQIEFQNVYGINNNEEDQMITSKGDSMTLKHPSQLTTNTQEVLSKENPQFHIFPNPTSSEINVKTKNGDFSKLVLYNRLGMILFQKQFLTPQKSASLNLSAFNFPKGIYFLEIRNKEFTIVEKVILK
ncbi:MAG: T9SS type A sorting domain-containing protein [Saprospiraceae bacterium]